jgi:putative DNA primase/helicase
MSTFTKLPAVLEPYVGLRHWVLWKFERKSNGKSTKPPFRPDGQYARPDDPNTWITFDEAITAYRAGGFDGVGFCLLGTDLAVFDLDDCRDCNNGTIEPAALRLVERAKTYCEITPSGAGLRIIGRGSGPELHRKQPVPGGNGVQVETYRRCARYITISGDVLPGTPEQIAELGNLPDEIVAKLDEEAAKAKEQEPKGPKGPKGPKEEKKKGRKRLNLDDVIKHGEGGHFNGDRSRAVWWTINELIRRGKTDDELVAVLLDRGNKISEHIFDQKQKPEAYARRQVQQARAQQAAAGPYGGLEDQVALEFSAAYAEHLRFVALWNKWLQWDGVHWIFEDTLHAFNLARLLCRKAENAAAKTVAAVVTLARTDRRQAATAEQWDADPWLLGTAGGTVDLHTGKLRSPKPGDYITKITSVAPGGDCPLWLAFLKKVTNGNQELQGYLQRVCGYCLTGSTKEDALFFLYGKGANGKSVFLRTVAGILEDYHRVASMEMFLVTRGERHPTDLAMLRGARLVTAVETEEGKRWDEAKLKALTGGDPIAARFMRQDFFKYVPQFKLMIAGNHKPAIRSVDEAIRRRMNLVPFSVTIPERERDEELSNKLKAEWSGILAWIIKGCLTWQRGGLKPPAAVTEATDKYLESQDDLQAFIDESCVVAKHEYDSVEHLWDGWVDWAEDCGEFVGSKRRFSERLQDKEFVSDRSGKAGTRSFRGIRCIRENAKKLAAEARRMSEEMGQRG